MKYVITIGLVVLCIVGAGTTLLEQRVVPDSQTGGSWFWDHALSSNEVQQVMLASEVVTSHIEWTWIWEKQ